MPWAAERHPLLLPIRPSLTPGGTHGRRSRCPGDSRKDIAMNSVIYVVGLVVIVIAVLSLIGLA